MFLAKNFIFIILVMIGWHSFPSVLCGRQTALKPLLLPQQPLRFQILSYYRGNYLQPRILQINDKIMPVLQPKADKPMARITTTTTVPITQAISQHDDKMYGTSSRNRNKKHRLRRLKTNRVDSYGTGKSRSRPGNNDDGKDNDNDLRFRFRSRARDMAGRAKDAKGYHNLYHKDETYKVEKFYDDDYSDHDYRKRIRDNDDDSDVNDNN